jgi:hypothetical protein
LLPLFAAGALPWRAPRINPHAPLLPHPLALQSQCGPRQSFEGHRCSTSGQARPANRGGEPPHSTWRQVPVGYEADGVRGASMCSARVRWLCSVRAGGMTARGDALVAPASSRRFFLPRGARKSKEPPGWRRYKNVGAGGEQVAKYGCRAQHAVPLRRRKQKPRTLGLGGWRTSSQVWVPGTACCAPTKAKAKAAHVGREGKGARLKSEAAATEATAKEKATAAALKAAALR